MTVRTRQFHKRDWGVGNEDWYSIAHDDASGRVYIIHRWSRDAGGLQFKDGSRNIELSEFLAETGRPQQKLFGLLATLVRDADDN